MLAWLISETYWPVVAFGLRRASAKACPGASTTRNGPSTPGPRKFAQNSAIDAASLGLGQPPAQQFPAVFGDCQNAGFGVKAGLQQRQFFVAHQHDEFGLRQPFGVVRIEHGRTERNRKPPVVRQAFARDERHPLHLLGAQALYRVTVDRADPHDHGARLLQPPPQFSAGRSRLSSRNCTRLDRSGLPPA